MNLYGLKKAVIEKGEKTFKSVNHFAKVERFIAAILTATPAILYYTDICYKPIGFRDSISDYVNMYHSYWFGSLIAMAAALFIFNGAQHMVAQEKIELSRTESRFGKGYNIIFGVALLGLLYFDLDNYKFVHYVFASIFFVGCALAMILTLTPKIKLLGDFLGWLTLVVLGVHFLLEYVVLPDDNWFTLLWAEWIGLFLIALYFIAESIERDKRQNEFV